MKATIFQETRHIEEDQMMPADPACPFCSSKDRIRVGLLQNNPEVALLACRDCHAASASRIPTSETLLEYYREYYQTTAHRGHKKRVTFDLTEKLATHIFNKTSQSLDKDSLNILDFGGGDGSIAVKIAENFLIKCCSEVRITLVDHNETFAQFDDDRICMIHKAKLADIPSGQYDLIIASAIIEHLPQPQEDIIKLLNLMHTGGMFYARTPYVIPFFKLAATLGRRLDFSYPGHLHDLGPSFWNTFSSRLPLNIHLEVLSSQPSMAETSFKDHFFRTLAAHFCKAPWYLFGNRYEMVGGWEVFLMKKS